MSASELRETLDSYIDRFRTQWVVEGDEYYQEELVADLLDAVIASLPKGGQVPKDLLEHKNSKVYSAVYKNGWSDHDKVIFELLQSAKSISKGE